MNEKRIDKVVSDKPSTWREEAEDRERYKELHDRIADKDLRIIELEGHSNALIEFLKDVQPSCCCGAEERVRLMAKHKELIGGDA